MDTRLDHKYLAFASMNISRSCCHSRGEAFEGGIYTEGIATARKLSGENCTIVCEGRAFRSWRRRRRYARRNRIVVYFRGD